MKATLKVFPTVAGIRLSVSNLPQPVSVLYRHPTDQDTEKVVSRLGRMRDRWCWPCQIAESADPLGDILGHPIWRQSGEVFGRF
jgi:hypothetical protein